jgi:hypothetical protein
MHYDVDGYAHAARDLPSPQWYMCNLDWLSRAAVYNDYQRAHLVGDDPARDVFGKRLPAKQQLGRVKELLRRLAYVNNV